MSSHFPHALPASHLKDQLYLTAGHGIDFQIVQLSVFLPRSAFANELVSIRALATAPDSILGHLRMRSFYSD